MVYNMIFKKSISKIVKCKSRRFTPTPQHSVMSCAFSRIKLIYKHYVSHLSLLYNPSRHKSTTPCLVSGFTPTPKSFFGMGLQSKRGFTLVEMLITISIFVVITSIVLTSHSKFSGNILVGNLAYDIALSVRQAQVYGLSVREFSAGSGEFDIGYGVHFDKDTPTFYILFADRNDDSLYNGVSEIVEVFNIKNGYGVSRFCAVVSSGTEECTPSTIRFLDIVFKRPDPEANISSNTGIKRYNKAEITVSSPQGQERVISIWGTGQISVGQ